MPLVGEINTEAASGGILKGQKSLLVLHIFLIMIPGNLEVSLVMYLVH